VIQAEGVEVREMYKTFNMGMGFAIIAPQREVRRIARLSDGSKQVGTISGRGIRVQHDGELVEISK
jgi:phosphoribosylformylglycinamidine cyclo-ligase